MCRTFQNWMNELCQKKTVKYIVINILYIYRIQKLWSVCEFCMYEEFSINWKITGIGIWLLSIITTM